MLLANASGSYTEIHGSASSSSAVSIPVDRKEAAVELDNMIVLTPEQRQIVDQFCERVDRLYQIADKLDAISKKLDGMLAEQKKWSSELKSRSSFGE